MRELVIALGPDAIQRTLSDHASADPIDHIEIVNNGTLRSRRRMVLLFSRRIL